jgi:hypothetical protein
MEHFNGTNMKFLAFLIWVISGFYFPLYADNRITLEELLKQIEIMKRKDKIFM